MDARSEARARGSGSPPADGRRPGGPDEGPVRARSPPHDGAGRAATGSLAGGGVDLVELAERFGTPLFVYDEEHLRARCREAVAAWGDGVAYATKAFLCRAMARLAHEEGMWLDVSTGGELHVALAAGVPAGTPRPARQQQVRGRAGTRPRRRGRTHRRRLLRRDRPARRV